MKSIIFGENFYVEKMEKIFPYIGEVEKQFNQAKKFFFASMNGVASEGMSPLGYDLNYGVTLPRIKAISQRLESKNLLAQRAWWSGIREMMIFATFNLEKDLNKTPYTINDLEEWSKRLTNLELCEQFSKNFLSKIIPDKKKNFLSEDFSYYLICKEERNEYHAALGYINLTNLMLQGVKLNNQELLLQKMVEDADSPLYNIYSTVCRCAKMAARENPDAMMEFLKNIQDKKGVGIKIICDEVGAELSYFHA